MMKIVTTVVLSLALAPAAKAETIAGCWELLVKPHFRGRLSFVVDGSALRGTATLHGDEHQVREGMSDGHRFSFKIEMSGTPIVLKVS